MSLVSQPSSSRIVGGQMLLDDLGKETLVRIIRKVAEFCNDE